MSSIKAPVLDLAELVIRELIHVSDANDILRNYFVAAQPTNVARAIVPKQEHTFNLFRFAFY